EASYSRIEREAYLTDFAMKTWPILKRHDYQRHEMKAIVHEITLTNGTLNEELRLVNIAALESFFDRKAIGKMGEKGAFQIMTGPDYSANQALKLMRVQGMLGYVGCPRETIKCLELISHRVDRADLYRMGFDPVHNQERDTYAY